MVRILLPFAALALLAACGSKQDLKPPPGQTLPPKSEGADTVPTPLELMTPTDQMRPQRSDEVLTQSKKREDDKFDLPPT